MKLRFMDYFCCMFPRLGVISGHVVARFYPGFGSNHLAALVEPEHAVTAERK
jgi:hypothetical protein